MRAFVRYSPIFSLLQRIRQQLTPLQHPFSTFDYAKMDLIEFSLAAHFRITGKIYMVAEAILPRVTTHKSFLHRWLEAFCRFASKPGPCIESNTTEGLGAVVAQR